MEKKLLVDGDECTLRHFIHVNTEQDGMIDLEDLLKVINAGVGEVFFIGIVEIKIL